MANREQLLYWDGVLKGNGQEAVCTVEVLEVTNPVGGPHAYRQFTIINVARSLPDGLYDLEAHGHTHQVRHANGAGYPSTGFGGASVSMTFKSAAIDQNIIDGKKMLVVQGCFAYPTFGKVRHSAFCYFWRGDITKPPNMNICSYGNNAD